MFDNTILLHQAALEQSQRMKKSNLLLIIIIILLAISNIYLVSRKNEVVRYVEFSTKGNFGFKVLPDSDLNVSQKKLLIEQQLENYVRDRVTNVTSKIGGNSVLIDTGRIKSISAISSKAVISQYQDEVMRIYNEAEFTKRDIEILSFSEIQNRQYRFDFETSDQYQDGRIKKNRWVVYINYELLDPNSLPAGETRAQNPLGIKITYYRGDLDKQTKSPIQNAF